MNIFIADAMAQSAGASQEPGFSGFFIMLIPIVVLWFLMIRPQMKRQKEHAKLVGELAKGDEAVTTGGILGRITEVGESFVKMEVAKSIEVKVQRHAIASIMPKGTIKES